MSWLKRLWWRIQDKIDPPCDHPVEYRRPSIITHYSKLPPSPAWVCGQCGMSHVITVEEFYSLFGRMPWDGPRRLP